MNNKNQFGIVQGRLTQSPPGFLQWFPQKAWPREFVLASKLGYGYIELIAERRHNRHNPLWSDEGIDRIKSMAKEYRLSLHAFCNDYIIEHSLTRDARAIEQTLALIGRGKRLGLRKLILPLFEQSQLTARNAGLYRRALRDIADAAAAAQILVCLETILNGKELLKLIKTLKHPNIKVVFDTGNRIAFGHDIYSDILLLGDHIRHVHLKDKNEKNENVFLGTGKVDFYRTFTSLSRIRYKGPLTFETCRGRNPIKTARYNKEFAQFLIGETSGV